MPDINELSERELEILRLVATGVSNKEIAQQLYISTNTVKVHLRNIFSKIGVVSRTEAAMFAVSNGLVPEVQTAVENLRNTASEPQESYTSVRGGLFPASSIQVTNAEPDRRVFRLFWVLAVFILIAASFFGYQFLNREQAVVLASPTQDIIPTSQARWRELAKLPSPRFGLALATYENKIYAIAGEGAGGASGAVERYNPDTNTWDELSEKPTPVGDVGAAIIGGKIYVPGGKTSSNQVTNILEIYDPLQDSWSKGTSLPVALSAYGLVAFEGKIYLFGGWDGENYLSTVYEYDPEQDRWTQKSTMSKARAYAGAVVDEGRIFVVGGYDGQNALRMNDQYSPQEEGTGQSPWESRALLPQGRYAMGIASIADSIYVVGGESDQRTLSNLKYNPQKNKWETFETAESRTWSRGGLAILGTDLHALGGMQGEQVSNNHLSYRAIYIIDVPVIR